jgi:protein SCO1/2
MSKAASSKKKKQERLTASERRVVGVGLGLALLFAVGMGLLMAALEYADTRQDGATGNAARVAIAPDYPRHLVDFSLVDQEGRAVTRDDLNGSFLVVGFVFTSCSTTCPVIGRRMEEIQAMTSGRHDVRLVSITVDPEDDTVPVLKQYSARFAAQPGRWSFLTGDQAVVQNLVGTSFLWRDASGQYAYMPGNFAHTERIVLVDPQGHIERYFNGLNDEVATAVVQEINRLKALPQ